MIEKLEPEDANTVFEYVLAEKLNEVIDIVNSRAPFIDKVVFTDDELGRACKKAAMTGDKKDLQEYLRLRRER